MLTAPSAHPRIDPPFRTAVSCADVAILQLTNNKFDSAVLPSQLHSRTRGSLQEAARAEGFPDVMTPLVMLGAFPTDDEHALSLGGWGAAR